jgi:hypothetical protein
MATVAKTLTPSLSSVEPPQNDTVPGLLAGEAIAPGDTCYVKSDGTVWRTNGTAATAPALYCRHLPRLLERGGRGGPDPLRQRHRPLRRRPDAGRPLLRLGDTQAPSTTPPQLGGTVAVAYAVDATQIHFFPVVR